jgi:LuxR family quorum sensing-dependent transcriptional regulator
MKKGFCVPIIRGNGFTACVTMAGEVPDFEPRAKKAMHLISLYAHARAVSLLNVDAGIRSDRRLLTCREAEALTWIGRGKTSWETGKIMGVTERTVVYFVTSAQRKLNAVTRTQAVVNAIFAKEIEIPR